MQLLALGLNHKTAPVEVREKLALPESAQEEALSQLVEGYGLREAAILNTCNRSEIYLASEGPEGLDSARRFLSEHQGVDAVAFDPHFYALSNSEVAMHLFRVASGVDSLVVGESQILGQVRQALERAQQQGSARLMINDLCQRSLRVGKRARAETEIGRGRLSISTAAVELAGQGFDRLEGRSAMLMGAGEMGELTAQYLVDGGVADLLVANRTYQRAVDLAARFGGRPVSIDEVAEHLVQVDIVISSTAASDFVIGADLVRQAMGRRRGRPLFLIDIAVPRDIDPEVRQIDNAFLFDIDNLSQVVESNRQEREGEILKVQQIIDEELAEFLRWFNSLGTGSLIKALRQHGEALRQLELERWQGKLAHLSEEDRKVVESLLRGYANKLLHLPQVQIREFANADDGYLRLDTVRQLFGLDQEEEDQGDK